MDTTAEIIDVKTESALIVDIENDDSALASTEGSDILIVDDAVELKLMTGYESNSSSTSDAVYPSCTSCICSECGGVYANSNSLRTHMLSHRKKHNVCDVCGRKLPRGADLASHMRLHGEMKPYQCGFCPKTFARRSSLKQHEKSHGNVHPSCEYCGAVFYDTARLEAHIQKQHIEEKPFKCETCGKGFGYSSSYKAHLKLHTGQRYECEFCRKIFATTASLRLHVRNHTGEKPYTCNLCKMSFRARRELVKHVSDECKLREQVGYHDNVTEVTEITKTVSSPEVVMVVMEEVEVQDIKPKIDPLDS